MGRLKAELKSLSAPSLKEGVVITVKIIITAIICSGVLSLIDIGVTGLLSLIM